MSKKTDKQTSKQPVDSLLGFIYNRKPSDKLILYLFLTAFVLCGLFTLAEISKHQSVTIPHDGGVLKEGVVGTPRFVNPVLAITRADQDLVALTYSGLLKLGADGKLENDIADTLTISEDGLVYNLTLKPNYTFHDGVPVTAEDIAYTIDLIQNDELKSPLRGNWNGVETEVISSTEINFILPTSYAPFVENLTVGILPKHIWSDLTTEELPFSQHNTEPIGSGPYKVGAISYNDAGLIKKYTLEAADRPKKANISIVEVFFYETPAKLTEAYELGEITNTTTLIDESTSTIVTPLPRVFTLYFNQNKSPVLREKAVRESLNLLVDRDELASVVFENQVVPAISPIPSGLYDADQIASSSEQTASAVLEASGWTLTEDSQWQKELDGSTTTLSVEISTANEPVFTKTATYLERVWSEAGIDVSVNIYEQSDLVQSVIRPRNYETLLFGADTGRALDLYPFWHSAEREDPGLNVGLYTNIATDAILEDLRATQDAEERNELITSFLAEIKNDVPAIFLFSPVLTYTLDPTIKYQTVTNLTKPSERFSTIENWYIKESNVWPLFQEENRE